LVTTLREFVGLEDALGVVVFDNESEVVGAVPIGVGRQSDLAQRPDTPSAVKRLSVGGIPVEARFVEFAEPVRVAAGAWITFDRRPGIQTLYRYRLSAVIIGGIVIGIGLLLALGISRAVVRPLVDLTEIVTRLAQGELSVRYRERGPNEVQRLARQVNRIAEQLEGSQVELSRTSSRIDGKVRGRTRYLEQTNRALIDLANRDPLTGLANRRRLEMELDRQVEMARETEQPFAVIMMDLDRFKQYNDTAGHLAGDELLQTVAAALRARTRITDLVVRWGGDEFCILVPYTTPDRAVAAADSLVEAVREATRVLPFPEELGPLGASAGVACFPEDAQDGTGLIARADEALYRVKETERGRALRLKAS
jgi:diguanylate cyclase (GGDEF)-like protein